MRTTQIVIGVLLLIVLGVPFAMSGVKRGDMHSEGAQKLIVVTPHVPQIRDEFARAFSEWHQREYGEAVVIDYRTPGGTSEIKKQLSAMFTDAVKRQFEGTDGSWETDDLLVLEPGAIAFDVMFGGGSYDHSTLKRGSTVSVKLNDTTTLELNVSQSAPMDFTQAELDELFGENMIGPQQLYDPEQYWIGTALSSFGIVYNRDVYEQRLKLDIPSQFVDLTKHELGGWIALADPRQSGSITTTFDSILGNEGWEEGWRILRGMCGNTRYFTNSSTKPPIDVSNGEAAAGLAIDFYGRGQAQVIKDSGGGDRVGYQEPEGAVYVDADPISIINGGPNPEVAKRFVRFCLTEEAQALWQFAKDNPDNPIGVDGEPMGPEWSELRRMPVRRMMYEQYFDYFMDQVNPFEIVSDVENPGWRTGVQVMMGCFGIDIAEDCRAAYKALGEAKASGAFSDAEIVELDALFFAFPETEVDGEMVPFTEATYRTVRNEWRKEGRQVRLEIEYTRFYRENYQEIIRRVEERR
ncbi:MAG: extracellular solute-binding protein [Phycisphaerales bacterium]|nr:extracellular solute-binding protein [Phycisphaerales bacterium]